MDAIEAAIERPTIALVRELSAALAADGVRYCHFKSNAFLDRSRRGENDLDLLIARADETRFAAIMHRLGLKLALRPDAPPGILDYYGLDAKTHRVVHVHAHYQLIAGDDLTKGYRIPLEEAFLAEVREDHGLLVPAPELEYILLVLRMVLKHSTWDAFLTRRARMPRSARDELEFLTARLDEAKVFRLLEQRLPIVDARSFAACRDALGRGATVAARIRAGHRLTTALRPCARRRRAADVTLKIWRRGAGLVHRLLGSRPRRKRLMAGGAIIAIVGADGAGKSTAVEGLGERLGRTFDTTRAHLGKPPPSMTTRLLRTASRARSAASKLLRLIGLRSDSSRSTERALAATALARDRYREFLRLRRRATSGELVVCDRYPLPELTLMDGPRVERIADAARHSGLIRRLAERERSYYQAIPRPEILIVLRVDPDTAVARTDDSPEFVRARWQEVLAIDWAAAGAHVIDAGESREAVLSRAEEHVWSAL